MCNVVQCTLCGQRKLEYLCEFDIWKLPCPVAKCESGICSGCKAITILLYSTEHCELYENLVTTRQWTHAHNISIKAASELMKKHPSVREEMYANIQDAESQLAWYWENNTTWGEGFKLHLRRAYRDPGSEKERLKNWSLEKASLKESLQQRIQSGWYGGRR